MAGFLLRKKPKPEAQKAQQTPAKPSPQHDTPPPLFARFASSSSNVSQQANPTMRLVSQPMALGSKAVPEDQPPLPSYANRAHNGPSSYSFQSQQSRPPSSVYPNAHSPSQARLAKPMLDKPLPVPVPSPSPDPRLNGMNVDRRTSQRGDQMTEAQSRVPAQSEYPALGSRQLPPSGYHQPAPIAHRQSTRATATAPTSSPDMVDRRRSIVPPNNVQANARASNGANLGYEAEHDLRSMIDTANLFSTAALPQQDAPAPRTTMARQAQHVDHSFSPPPQPQPSLPNPPMRENSQPPFPMRSQSISQMSAPASRNNAQKRVSVATTQPPLRMSAQVAPPAPNPTFVRKPSQQRVVNQAEAIPPAMPRKPLIFSAVTTINGDENYHVKAGMNGTGYPTPPSEFSTPQPQYHPNLRHEQAPPPPVPVPTRLPSVPPNRSNVPPPLRNKQDSTPVYNTSALPPLSSPPSSPQAFMPQSRQHETPTPPLPSIPPAITVTALKPKHKKSHSRTGSTTSVKTATSSRPPLPNHDPSALSVATSTTSSSFMTKSRPTTPNTSSETSAPSSKPPKGKRDTHLGLLDDDPFAKPDVKMIKRVGSRETLNEGAMSPPPPMPAALASSPPPSPNQQRARTNRRGEVPARPPSPLISKLALARDRPAEPFPLPLFLSDANLFATLISFLSFSEWCTLSSVSKRIRFMFVQPKNEVLKECILERFLGGVGYKRWDCEQHVVDGGKPDKGTEPLVLTLGDLHDYMRGVSIPTHEYARVATTYVEELNVHPNLRDPELLHNMRQLTAGSRAYTKVVLRLRAQAEKEVKEARKLAAANGNGNANGSGSTATTPTKSYPPVTSMKFGGSVGRSSSRHSSRAPSPAMSMFSSGHSTNYHSNAPPSRPPMPSPVSSAVFRSPLFKLNRAPLLRVFVPSPEGDWLSDASILECEAELERAGVKHLLRLGDVVWDVGAGDEGNVGRLVWDGSYLIDLDYTYSASGDLPKYLPTLAFSPSYFYRVIRGGQSNGNPIVRLDLSPWGEEIAMNLQLLQDRIRTETPQGAVHNVVRWVHRSHFLIRPPPLHSQSPTRNGTSSRPRIPIPNFEGMFVDPGWYGTIVVETEGTNECLADLQDRCGPGAFPPRPHGVARPPKGDRDAKIMFRILREKSRPGEIWIRTVNAKERLH